jgi:hypothetical protein
MPAGVVSGSSIKGAKRQRVIDCLVAGDSHSAIARRLHISRPVVAAVERAEFDTVSQRKERLAVLSERGAMLAGERLIADIEAGKIKAGSLVAPFGVFVDKALALRGDGIVKVQHEHTHRLSADDILGFAVQRSQQLKQANARTLPDATKQLPGPKTGQTARNKRDKNGQGVQASPAAAMIETARQGDAGPRKKSVRGRDSS